MHQIGQSYEQRISQLIHSSSRAAMITGRRGSKADVAEPGTCTGRSDTFFFPYFPNLVLFPRLLDTPPRITGRSGVTLHHITITFLWRCQQPNTLALHLRVFLSIRTW